MTGWDLQWQRGTGVKHIYVYIYAHSQKLSNSSKIIWICVVLNNSTGKLELSWQTSAALPSLFSLYFLLWPQFRKDQYNNRSMLNNKTTIIIWTELFYCTESKHTTEGENAQKKTCFISNMHVELQLTVHYQIHNLFPPQFSLCDWYCNTLTKHQSCSDTAFFTFLVLKEAAGFNRNIMALVNYKKGHFDSK